MDEIECTAIVGNGGATRHLLYTPPCSCPNCAPGPVASARDGRHWLRLPGRSQRQRVEEIDLGETGRHVLG